LSKWIWSLFDCPRHAEILSWLRRGHGRFRIVKAPFRHAGFFHLLNLVLLGKGLDGWWLLLHELGHKSHGYFHSWRKVFLAPLLIALGFNLILASLLKAAGFSFDIIFFACIAAGLLIGVAFSFAGSPRERLADELAGEMFEKLLKVFCSRCYVSEARCYYRGLAVMRCSPGASSS